MRVCYGIEEEGGEIGLRDEYKGREKTEIKDKNRNGERTKGDARKRKMR